jgi:hypothetical protein
MRSPLLCTPSARLAWLKCVFLLSAAACSSSTDEARVITSTPEGYCQDVCEKAHACSDAIAASECRSSCQAGLAGTPPLRADFLAYVAGCIADSNCASTTAAKCQNEARAQLSASSFGKGFCASYVSAGARCDESGESYTEQACLEAAKSYDDSSLQAANECLARTCAAQSACLALTIPDVTLSP